ncbi:tailspike protein [Aeromonas phage vB_AveS_KLEA5]|nr:tailspike protein [Aeromonas phage vB_AveS_KLEA5]
MSCSDIPSLLDLQKAKLNVDDLGRLMGTGTGTSTNGVTGQVRPTYNSVLANLGYTRVGSFASGGTLLNGRQTLLWDIANGGDGQEYGWSGSFLPSGKVVPPGSTPLTEGGIAVGAWISRFDPELRVQVYELTRRSYAGAGYNLVTGSFESGGTLVNANDVLLQESTGKAFSGPAGVVAAGTNPASGGFIDRSPLLPRVITTVSSVNSGMFPVGTILELSDRNGGLFTVFSGGTADGLGIIDAGGGKTAQYEWSQPEAGDPRHFGGRPNDDTFDSTAAVKYAAENSRLYFDGIYTISDEVVIKTGSVIRSIGKSGVKVKTGSSMTGKAAIRASYLPIGTTPDMTQMSNQIRGLSQEGQLYIDANNVADFAFYGRGIVAESELDFIVGERAKVCGVSLLTSWFSAIKTGFFGLNSGVNVSLGASLAGETGDIFVNGMLFPLVASYSTRVPVGVTYNQDGTAAEQKAGAGVLLGIGFGNRISTLVSQASQGANLVASKVIGFAIGSAYVESGSKATPSRKTSILIASDNNDNATLPIDLLHLEAGQQILNRSSNLLLDIGALYRYDNVQSFDGACVAGSIKVKEPSFYVRNAYSNNPPAALSYERASIEVFANGPVDSATAAASRLATKWLFRKGSHTLKVKLSAPTASPVTVRLTTDSTTEFFNVSDELSIGLSSARADGNWYDISVSAPAAEAGTKATLVIYRKTTAWGGV